jgi:hypothetical protein
MKSANLLAELHQPVTGVRGGQIVAIDFLADPERLRRLDLTILDD